MQVTVRDNNVDQALKALKKKMQREGIFREMKLRRSYEKLFVRTAQFHFTEDTLALHFLLERLQGLIDIVITNGDLHGCPTFSK